MTTFTAGSTVECIIPDHSLYYGFTFLPVKISSIGVKNIGKTSVTYYVVNYPNSPVQDSITTEEWQLRPHDTSRPKGHCGGVALKQGDYVEVGWVMHDNLYWFLAQVEKDSPAAAPKVKVSYLSKFYANVEESERVLIDKSSVVKVPPNDKVVHGLWAQSIDYSRVISDEEHLIPEKYEEFCEIKEKMTTSPITEPRTFEPTRERLVELADSFINARHYDKGTQALNFLIQIEQSLTNERTGTTATTTTTTTPTSTTSATTASTLQTKTGEDGNGDRKRRLSDTIIPIASPPLQKKQKLVHTTTPTTGGDKEGFCFFGAKLF